MQPEIRTPIESDLEALLRVDGRAFGSTWKPGDFDAVRPVFDLSRFRIVVDDETIVGVAGSWGFELTVPGGATIPAGGVTWVAVEVTHRRRGLLRRLLDAVHADVDARAEPVAVLTASEGSIYERFGYGIATWQRRVHIDRQRSEFREVARPGSSQLRVIEGDELVAAITDRWERARRGRPGELSRSAAWQRMLVTRRGAEAVYVVHEDGYAAWTIAQNWNDGHPKHEMELHELVAATPRAHRELWQTILSVDLVGPIVSWSVPNDDPLGYLLSDHRCVRTTGLNDGLWVNLRSVPEAFGARTYGTDDDLVVEVDGRRWRIGGAGCSKVRTRADLVTDHASLGALLLGGVRPSALAAGDRLTARSDEIVRRADAMFVTSPQPYCQTSF